MSFLTSGKESLRGVDPSNMTCLSYSLLALNPLSVPCR